MRDAVAKPTQRATRLRRMASEWKGPRVGWAKPMSPAVVAAAAGLVTGLLELGLTLALKPLYDPAPGFFRANRHIVWIIPVVNLVVFGVVGLLCSLPRLGRTPARRLARFVLGFLGALTLLLTIRQLHIAACALLAAGLAYRLGPPIGAIAAARRRLTQSAIVGLVIITAGLVALSGGREVLNERLAMAALPPAPSGAPNVLFLVLDTVRADHLSLYGYDRDTTPNLARLARRGVRFDQARSTAPWTLPSHASMFTGRWPHELSAGMQGPLDQTHPTLAESLRGQGYATAGFISNIIYCSAESGLARGFVHYEDHLLTLRGLLRSTALGRRILDPVLAGIAKLAALIQGQSSPVRDKAFKDAATINAEFLSWLPDQPRRPFFAFLNYFDAHHPYLLPEGEDKHFGLYPESRRDVLMLHRWWSLDKRRLPRRDLDLARDSYDDCIAYLDDQLGRLFAELDRRGVLDNTLVIVTADHGEHFGEHELFGHASSLYSPEVHVPLVLVGPGVPSGQSVSAPVSLRDLSATVTDLVRTPGGPLFPGRSLARFWSGSTPPTGEPVLSEVDSGAKGPANGGRSPVFRGPMKALMSGQTVYVRNGDGREELYDLAADPGETHNLADRTGSTETLEQLRKALARIVQGEP